MTAESPAVERVHPPAWLIRILNPVVRRVVERGRGPAELAVLRYTGRRTGKEYAEPAGFLTVDGQPCIQTNSRWRHNFAGGREVEVTVGGQRRRMRGVLVDDPDDVTDRYARLIGEHGVGWARRRLGIRVHVDREPTREELREMIARSGLSTIRLDPA